VIFEDKNFKVTALPTDHGIESFAYRVEEADHPGELQVEKLRELNIPSGPVYGKLKRGEVVTLEDGRTLDGRDYIGLPKKGRVVVISGDTRKNKNVEKLAQDADVLVHESTFASGEERIAYRYFHSTAKQAAEVAKAANAKKLYLTHISARYLKFDAIGLQKQAQKVFKNSQVVFDFDEFDIPMAEGHDEK
jgi:ribonuclease Z